MKLYVYEGSPAELLEVHQGLAKAANGISGASSLDQPDLPEEPSSSEEGDHTWCSTEVAYRVITRIKLSKEQQKVLTLLEKAGDQWVLASQLQKEIGYSPSQFAGLMGAFGRRFTHTKGFVLGSWFFDQEWDNQESCYRYRLPPSVREAVKRAGLK